MKLSQPCSVCNTLESHSYRYKQGTITCGDCAHISINTTYNLPSYKQQRAKHAKDLIQPFKTERGQVVENRDFTKVYGQKKLDSYKQFMKDQQSAASKAQQSDKALQTALHTPL